MFKPPVLSLVAALAVLATMAACDKSSPTEPSPGPCTYALSTNSLSFGPSGGAASVSVTAASHCTWTAVSDRAWMSISSGANGTGNGVVNVSLAPNTQETSRTGILTIAGQTVSAVQEGLGACSLQISPTEVFFSKDPGTGNVSVTAAAHCSWTATADSEWLTITSGSTGTGNGSVVYAIDRNRDVATRRGSVVIGGQMFVVNQAGDTPPPLDCEYSIAPIQFSACMSVPYTLTAAITTRQGCTWTATSGAPWITVADGQSGTGSGVITFRLSDNWEAPRSGVVRVRWPTVTAGQNLQVSQAGCYYAVSTGAISIAGAGGTGRFDVYQQSDPNTCGGPTQNACLWTAQADVSWITITTTMPQVGDNPVSFTVAANPGTTARAGRITVRDKVVLVTQTGQ